MAKHKLSKKEATIIRQLWWCESLSYRELSKMFRVNVNSIRMIVLGRTYVDPEYIPPKECELKRRIVSGAKRSKPTGKFSDGDIFTILKLWHSGTVPLLEIARNLNANRSTIANVIYGYAYRDIADQIRKELGVLS